jgi:hypothetical protein
MATWKYITAEAYAEIAEKAPGAAEVSALSKGVFEVVSGTILSSGGERFEIPAGTKICLLDAPVQQPWCYAAEAVVVRFGLFSAEVKRGRPLFVLPTGYNPG